MPSVRPARPADAEAIARVYVETWRAAYAGLLPDRVLLDLSLARQTIGWSRAIGAVGPGQSVLVAEDETAGVVGVGSCGRVHRSAPLTFEGEVYTLYVDPDHQERGLGRGLLDGLFGTLREGDIGSALIWVLADNPARFFYEAMGGRRAAERTELLWGEPLGEIAYGWPDLARLPALARPDTAP